MSTGQVGVAISTTGDEHRLGFLETAVKRWGTVEGVDSLFVTVDGDETAVARVAHAVRDWTHSVYQVGQRLDGTSREGRLGVAVNKNTGLELLMDACIGQGFPSIEHLFLSDDDIWPRGPQAIRLHTGSTLKHSMVCWGRARLQGSLGPDAWWKWPRGVLLYTHRSVVSQVGGMDERFGPGGHEHAEWSRRIHQAGITPVPFGTPAAYAHSSAVGSAMGAHAFWHAEDMPRVGESTQSHRDRKGGQTSVRRQPGDWEQINEVMEDRDGDTRFAPFRAASNDRRPATVAVNLTGQGAEGAEAK